MMPGQLAGFSRTIMSSFHFIGSPQNTEDRSSTVLQCRSLYRPGLRGKSHQGTSENCLGPRRRSAKERSRVADPNGVRHLDLGVSHILAYWPVRAADMAEITWPKSHDLRNRSLWLAYWYEGTDKVGI